MDEFNSLYTLYEPLYLSNDLGNELLNSIELFDMVDNVQTQFYSMLDSSHHFKKTALQVMQRTGRKYFRSNAMVIDRRIMPGLLGIYAKNTAPDYHPAFYQQVRDDFKGNYDSFIDKVFNQSIFTDSTRYMNLLSKSQGTLQKKLTTDPLVVIYRDFSRKLLFDVYKQEDSLNRELIRLYRKYLLGQMAMDTSRIFYPDANFTMRLAYGKVEGYRPSDAVNYQYYSTVEGIMEKENPEIDDYRVPAKLKEVVDNRDFEPYTRDGQVPVCFIASNHTSGGNSGSPVLNANGNLIGINFDRNWEGTVSDYAYDPAICRNITLDIRYVLFIIDKVANADWLLDELTILKH